MFIYISFCRNIRYCAYIFDIVFFRFSWNLQIILRKSWSKGLLGTDSNLPSAYNEGINNTVWVWIGYGDYVYAILLFSITLLSSLIWKLKKNCVVISMLEKVIYSELKVLCYYLFKVHSLLPVTKHFFKTL